jgi:hypothetical protein
MFGLYSISVTWRDLIQCPSNLAPDIVTALASANWHDIILGSLGRAKNS